MLLEIAKYFISVGFVTGAIVYLFKTFFEKWIDDKKADYQSELDRQLEDYRIQKELISDQNSIVFNRLHEERAVVIKDLYFKLVDMTASLNSYLNDVISFMNKTTDISRIDIIKKRVQAYEILEEYVLYSERNIIFFDKEFSYKLQFFNRDTIKLIKDISDYIENDEQFTEKEDDLLRDYRKTILAIKTELESRFRKMLGSE